MTKRNVEAYAAAQQPLCVQNDTIPESLFQEYGVNRGLRDANGVGVLTGLTNISKIVSFQNVGGKRMPCEGQLWYRGYNIKDLIGGLGPQEFGFEKIAYLLVFGQMPTPEELAETRVGETPAEANGWGILDHGVGSLEKVHVVNGRTVDVDMGQETAYVYMAGKRYRLRGDVLTEED